MSIEDLVARVVTAERAAFTQARELHPDESFYCYALYTGELASYILPTCCSEEGLQVVASQYAEKSGGTVEEWARDLRWNPPDWPFHMLGEEHFAGVLETLESRDDPWNSKMTPSRPRWTPASRRASARWPSWTPTGSSAGAPNATR